MPSAKGKINPKIYQLMVEQSKDHALFVLDPNGYIHTWNRGARRLKGYEAGEIIGQHFSTFYTEEAKEIGWPQYELEVAAREGNFEDEGWRVRKDGSQFWANVVITALHNEKGELLGFSKITRDLSERKQQEENLRQSEERFRLLVDGVVDYAIFMLDSNGVVSSWNMGAERIMGYQRGDIIGQHFARFYPLSAIKAGKPEDELNTARRIGRVEDEGWRVKKNGERFWARTITSALRDSQAQLRGFALVTQDLTDRRHIQELENAARNVNDFIATLAHELRNPLAPIRTAVFAMSKVSPDTSEYEALRQMIDRQSAHMAHILDDMMDISRISRGTMRIEQKRVDFQEVIRRAVDATVPLMGDAGHHLHLDLPAEPLFVRGDLHRLTQLLSNLLNNSVRYTPRGGHISISASAGDEFAIVSVRDTGKGIDPRMMEHMFDMFVQGRSPLQRVGEGIGIGLALARKIAELHQGSLVGYSEGENRGSEFTVRIPLDMSVEDDFEVPLDAPHNGRSFAVRRILIVDDNIDAAAALNLLLQSLGYETCVVNDGFAALKKAVEFRPDVILLDIGMPGLDGYEVARRLRPLKSERFFKIIAVTGWGHDSDKVKSKEAGFDLHLVKPVKEDELAQAVGGKNLLH